MMIPDIEILEAIKSGRNQWVLNILYKRTLPKIKALIRKMKGRDEDALDTFQEAVMIFYREVKLDKLLPSTNVDGYIYSVSRNLYLNKLRVLNRYTDVDVMSLETLVETGIERHLELKDSENEIMSVLSSLGDKCRELLKALIFDDLDYQEVADKYGMASADVVKTQKHRCKKKLEEKMAQFPNLFKKLNKMDV
ncbi:MAG: sigma-70 family RNA polymerase sigma factor [Cytophagaceae bacterium]|jgi:RNA polymerase sigma factor (sigma-70 family)|nr:sigma-70 family RNA polymerase sigma factor [Cytophagaceae bacterium]